MSKLKIILEYQIQCTTLSLFRAISTPRGLEAWFADKVENIDARFTFFWNKIPSHSRMLKQKENSYIRFSWDDEPDYFFEFRIEQLELTGDISLIITDFANADEYAEIVELWNLQVGKLKRSIGCVKK